MVVLQTLNCSLGEVVIAQWWSFRHLIVHRECDDSSMLEHQALNCSQEVVIVQC